MIFDQKIFDNVNNMISLAAAKMVRVATAESCTGGLIGGFITEIPGASEVFDCGFITYSNCAKHVMLGVDNELIKKYGAVSVQVAKAMAKGAVMNSTASLSVAVTGIAGPSGGSKIKPVGLVYIASYNRVNNKMICRKFNFKGDRHQIRMQTVSRAITILTKQINTTSNFYN